MRSVALANLARKAGAAYDSLRDPYGYSVSFQRYHCPDSGNQPERSVVKKPPHIRCMRWLQWVSA